MHLTSATFRAVLLKKIKTIPLSLRTLWLMCMFTMLVPPNPFMNVATNIIVHFLIFLPLSLVATEVAALVSEKQNLRRGEIAALIETRMTSGARLVADIIRNGCFTSLVLAIPMLQTSLLLSFVNITFIATLFQFLTNQVVAQTIVSVVLGGKAGGVNGTTSKDKGMSNEIFEVVDPGPHHGRVARGCLLCVPK